MPSDGLCTWRKHENGDQHMKKHSSEQVKKALKFIMDLEMMLSLKANGFFQLMSNLQAFPEILFNWEMCSCKKVIDSNYYHYLGMQSLLEMAFLLTLFSLVATKR